MSGATVFVSRLVGLDLLASDGAAVGRVVDAVIGYPAPDAPPPVLGFVAEVYPVTVHRAVAEQQPSPRFRAAEQGLHVAVRHQLGDLVAR